jgi:hypothetical protein
MAVSRKRRIVKWAALAFAILSLLLASYVASWGAIQWLDEVGYDWVDELRLDDNLFAPLALYADSELPLADDLRAFRMWCSMRGSISWELADDIS